MIVNGFAKQVLKELPMEFAVEAQKLLGMSLEGSVGLAMATKSGCTENRCCAIEDLHAPDRRTARS